MATKQLTAPAEQFAQAVARATGLDLNVVRAWVALESAWGTKPAGAYNFLNIRGSNGGWAEYSSASAAAAGTVKQLTQAPEWYGGITSSATKPPAEQLHAIAASPWDGGFVPWGDPRGHYGGSGQNLDRTYMSMVNLNDPAQFLQTVGQGNADRFLKGIHNTPSVAIGPGTIAKVGASFLHLDFTTWVLDLGLILLAGGLVLVGSKQLFDKQVGPIPGVPV